MFFKKFLIFLLPLFSYALIDFENRKTSFEIYREYVRDYYNCFKISPPKTKKEALYYGFENKKCKGAFDVSELKKKNDAIYMNNEYAICNIYNIVKDFANEKGYKYNDKKLWDSIINYAHFGYASHSGELTLGIKRKNEYYLTGNRVISFSYIVLDQIFDVFEKKRNSWCLVDDICFNVSKTETRYLINSFSKNEYGISEKLFDFIVFLKDKLKREGIELIYGDNKAFYFTLINDIDVLYSRRANDRGCWSCIKKLCHDKLTSY